VFFGIAFGQLFEVHVGGRHGSFEQSAWLEGDYQLSEQFENIVQAFTVEAGLTYDRGGMG